MSLTSKILALCLVCLTASVGNLAQAQTPTPQQIEQFKKLPRAQQEQLARQMGFDLNLLSATGASSADSEESEQPQGPFPRGTLFDEFGNPIFEPEEEEQPEEEELTLFGMDLFANAPASFTSVTDLPVPTNYTIGPGDQLRLQLYGTENEEYLLDVNRDGTIVIPQLGPYSVASLTFAEAKAFLSEQVKKQMSGVQVLVSMGELRSMRIFVMGEAYKPGAYNVSSLSTITNALFAAGGVSDIASLRNIQLKRNGQLVSTLDLYDLLISGDSRNDVQLQAGDVVLVPTVSKTVTVDGLVRRPAIYEIKDEKRISEILGLAGGILAEGFSKAISIKRFVNGTQLQLTADITSQDIPVSDGDAITVPKVSPFVTQSVSLIGAVARPGKYQWVEGMRIRDLLGNLQQDLLETADLTYVLVVRDINDNRDIAVLQTDLTRSLQTHPEQNLTLAANDRVLVFSRVEVEQFGNIQLEDMAFPVEELIEQERERWEKRVDEHLFWQSVGLIEDESERGFEFETPELIQNQSILDLTDDERARLLDYRDATFYSRKRMLAPIITKLQEQAKFGQPLQLVEIAGEVKLPGIYPLTLNGGVKALLTAAGGLTESFYPMRSEITRTQVTEMGSASIEHITFSPKEVLSGGASEIVLKSKDRVNIFAIPSWQEELKVEVVGEVEFPGEYTISQGETLSDLLKRVGGISQYGDPDAVVFTRESLRKLERENLQKLAAELRKQIASESLRRQTGAGSIVSYDEAKNLLRDLSKAEAVGRLVINLPNLLAGLDGADVSLENGDTIYIPRKSQSVNVIGEVYVPTSHLYAAGLSFEEYIVKSGGYRALADKERTYIIRANGSVEIPGADSGFWFSKGDAHGEVMPGDTIVVPFDSDSVDNMTLWTNATQILYQLAVAVAAIGSL